MRVMADVPLPFFMLLLFETIAKNARFRAKNARMGKKKDDIMEK